VSAEPWYASGLRFGCQRCGACCSGEPGYVWLQAADAAALAGELGLGLPEFRSAHPARRRALSLREEADGRCAFRARARLPRVRRAPRDSAGAGLWPRLLASRAAWDKEAATCPGMGRGELFGREQIERLAGR
jgi:hypothetical protein